MVHLSQGKNLLNPKKRCQVENQRDKICFSKAKIYSIPEKRDRYIHMKYHTYQTKWYQNQMCREGSLWAINLAEFSSTKNTKTKNKEMYIMEWKWNLEWYVIMLLMWHWKNTYYTHKWKQKERIWLNLCNQSLMNKQ